MNLGWDLIGHILAALGYALAGTFILIVLLAFAIFPPFYLYDIFFDRTGELELPKSLSNTLIVICWVFGIIVFMVSLLARLKYIPLEGF